MIHRSPVAGFASPATAISASCDGDLDDISVRWLLCFLCYTAISASCGWIFGYFYQVALFLLLQQYQLHVVVMKYT